MKYILCSAFFLLFLSSFGQAKFVLKLDLNIGDKYLFKTDIHSVTTQNVMGELQVIKKENFFLYTSEVIDKPNSSTLYLKLTFKQLSARFEVDNESHSFGSDSTNTNDHQLNKIYCYMIGKPIYILKSSSGHTIRIDSLDKIYTDYTLQQTEKEPDTTLFNDTFGNEAMDRLTSTTIFSNLPVTEKALWFDNKPRKTGILKVRDSNLFIDKIENKTYTIKKTAELSSDKEKSIPMNKIYLNYMITGFEEAEDLIDKKTCMIIYSKTIQEAEGTVSMKYNENSEAAYSWPITIKNITTVNVTKL